jgi:hypothetical protein
LKSMVVIIMKLGIVMAFDRTSSGLDPNGMYFNHISCSDIGCKYGGWGSVIFKITVEDI